MKQWTRILMSLLVLVFTVPCGHAAEHLEHDHAHHAPADLCAAHTCVCHECAPTPCAKETVPDAPLPETPLSAPPPCIRVFFVRFAAPHHRPALPPPPVPPGMLTALQTIQLLI